MDAATAAFKVGYESPSQFSREYSRQFGSPPLKDIKSLQQMSRDGRNKEVYGGLMTWSIIIDSKIMALPDFQLGSAGEALLPIDQSQTKSI